MADVTVRLPGAVFEFTHINYRGGAMDAVLSTWREAPDDPLAALDYDARRVFRYHISGRSLSNVTAYRRELEKFHGNDLDWGRLLHDAIREAEHQYTGSVQSLDPWEQPEGLSVPLVDGVFPAKRVSCVFGMGGTGKSLLVEAILATASRGEPWLERETQPVNTLWLDYENEHEGDFAERRLLLAEGGLDYLPGSIRWMPGRGIPIADLTDTITREMVKFHCGGLVIDSVAFACGGDPSKAEIATGFYGSLAQLPVSTKILIAHTDKAENDKYPFGSIFWHNGIHGMSWYVKGVEGAGVLDVAWYNRKTSNGPRPRDFAVRLMFDDGIRVQPGNLKAINQATGRATLNEKIRAALASEGAMKAADLARAISADEHQVRTRLGELKGKEGGTIRMDDGRWGLAL